MKTVIALLFMATLAHAQSKKTIAWKDLKAGPLAGPKKDTFVRGTRVKLTLLNGNTLRGFVIHPGYVKILHKKNWRPSPYDFSKVDTVTLDLSIEYPELTGYVTLKKADLKLPIYELSPLSAATLRKLKEAKNRIKIALQEAADRYAAKQKMDKEAADKLREEAKLKAEEEEFSKGLEGQKKKIEKLEKALAFYQRFPEGTVEEQQAGSAWGPERIKMLKQKSLQLIPPTGEEQEFLLSYDLWLIGKKYQAEQKKKEEE